MARPGVGIQRSFIEVCCSHTSSIGRTSPRERKAFRIVEADDFRAKGRRNVLRILKRSSHLPMLVCFVLYVRAVARKKVGRAPPRSGAGRKAPCGHRSWVFMRHSGSARASSGRRSVAAWQQLVLLFGPHCAPRHGHSSELPYPLAVALLQQCARCLRHRGLVPCSTCRRCSRCRTRRVAATWAPSRLLGHRGCGGEVAEGGGGRLGLRCHGAQLTNGGACRRAYR